MIHERFYEAAYVQYLTLLLVPVKYSCRYCVVLTILRLLWFDLLML